MEERQVLGVWTLSHLRSWHQVHHLKTPPATLGPEVGGKGREPS